MSVTLAADSLVLVLPDPEIGDSFTLTTSVIAHRMQDNTVRTVKKLPAVTYQWNFQLNKCFDFETLLSFFEAARGKELTVTPWWTTSSFYGYFDADEILIGHYKEGNTVQLRIARRLSAVGDIR